MSAGEYEFEFLGERGVLANKDDWNHTERSKLWLYNLHYLDDLCAWAAEDRVVQHRVLFTRWIEENPPLAGNGWEPYTLSLRLVNLVKWLGHGLCLNSQPIPNHWLQSLARQAQALSAQREFHILANHLFANGKALTFAGAFLDGQDAERWLSQGLVILDAEIPEQFLGDGGHFERSPMYHATLLWDLADLIHLAECSGLNALRERTPTWRQVLAKGLAWLEMMSHPDGDISFFNDAAFGIAPTLAGLQDYAELLSVRLPKGVDRPLVVKHSGSVLHVEHAVSSGYIALNWGDGDKAILDLAPVGPDYQPGHAHADTLSMELSLSGQRVLVNSGTSCYGNDNQRQWQRSTAAHNTVTVDGADSSEVWAGFRVARRAYPKLDRHEADDRQILIEAHHSGFERLQGRNCHARTWKAKERSLEVHDAVTGRHGHAVARWYFHPEVECQWQEDALVIRLPTGQTVGMRIDGAEQQRLEASTWHPAFGSKRSNYCLAVTFTGGSLTTMITW
ncbi:Uncharacterized conserved protein, heparinase superfamily [Franzmannia pantelleriensis]|uniref:Uncharacterized conserved protein, heparinase superfamily n=2 Tax=Franzmannia pantelleriensis TaxID=48727 RepID=A0A1G9EDZ9_9GAMM|nr:Uncharacterized conserved protein, heparinase superfamily [Halomonas pantelleriensis]